MAAMLVVALAVPFAFGADAVWFGVGYLVVHLLNVALLAIAAGGNRDLRRVLMRIAPSAALAPLMILVAGSLGERDADLLHQRCPPRRLIRS